MSYQEKRAIVSLITTIAIAVFYTAFMAQRYPQGDPYSMEVFHFWGTFFLILILVTIVVKIAVTILFSIGNTIATREPEPSITDERDKIIELKSDRRSFYIFSIGFLISMVALVLSMPPSVMFIILFCAGIASEIMSEFSQFYFYRRGGV